MTAYGGVAAAYCRYIFDGEPYKKDGKMFIIGKHPITKVEKEIRWYTDAAHAANMPAKKQYVLPLNRLGKGKEVEYVQIIPDKFLTQNERESYFFQNWLYGTHWFWWHGSIPEVCSEEFWYAKSTEPLPNIRRKDKVITIPWEDFNAAAEKHGWGYFLSYVLTHDFSKDYGYKGGREIAP